MILKFQENITEIPKKYRHMVKDFYKTPTGTWMIDLVDGYTTSYGTNYIENKYKKDCLYELMNEVSADEVIINMDESKNTKPINKEKIEEASRNELLALAKMQTKTRYEKAAGYKGFSIVDIDTSMLLRDDTITVTCNVGKYYDTIQLMDVLIWIQMESERNPNNQVNTKAITAALMEAIDALEIKVNCTCADWCLEENTKIKLLNNEVVTIKKLKDKFDNNEELWVYSTDEQGDFKPGKVTNVWISGKANKMVKVTLDNDKEIITTLNHKYMMRDGSYKKAEDLSENDSLMPCNVNHKVKKVEYIYYDDPIDVYDLEVDNYHNFYVDAGVMLHNCYRFAYQATQLDYKYGKPENRPADITNPHNYGVLCKHLISMLSNKKWLQQVTGTIMDWVVKNIDKVNEFLRPKEGMELTLPNELARQNAKLGFYSKLFKDKLEDEPEEEVEDNVDNNNDTNNSNDNNDNVEDNKDNNQNNSNNINNDNSDDLDDSNINSDEEEDNG